jgi:hypothetical protein
MGVILYKKQKWENAFDEWVRLLQVANAEEEMLKDPKAVWDEAWRHAFMISLSIVNSHDVANNTKAIQDDLIKELK